jgi:methenyltetrahydromethanopterin cyclohydrolase
MPPSAARQAVRAIADGTGLSEEAVVWTAATMAVVGTVHTVARVVDLVLDLSAELLK